MDLYWFAYLQISHSLFQILCEHFGNHILTTNFTPKPKLLQSPVYCSTANNSRANNRFALEDVVGLVLLFINTKCEQKVLSLVFGVSRQNINRYLRTYLPLMVEYLNLSPDSQVSWPTCHGLQIWHSFYMMIISIW